MVRKNIPEKIPVFMASDNDYAAITDVAIISILENTKSDIDLFLITNDIDYEKLEKIKHTVSKYKNAKIEFINIDIKKMFSSFKTWRHVSITGFARLLIPWIKPNIDRAIYVDGDVVFIDDIAKLYSYDIKNFPLGAAKAIEIGNTTKAKQKILQPLELDDNHTYFNSGVLLINCKKWRADKKLPNGFFEIEQNFPNHICADQDILNKYFENNYFRLPQKFNVTFCQPNVFESYEEYENTMADMVVRHFVGPSKVNNSINNNCTAHLSSYYKWWQYAQKSDFFAEFIIKMIQKYAYNKKRHSYWLRLFGIIPFIKHKKGTLFLFGLLPIISTKRE